MIAHVSNMGAIQRQISLGKRLERPRPAAPFSHLTPGHGSVTNAAHVTACRKRLHRGAFGRTGSRAPGDPPLYRYGGSSGLFPRVQPMGVRLPTEPSASRAGAVQIGFVQTPVLFPTA